MNSASSSRPILNILDIVDGTSVDGPGLRTSIYLAGCTHRCPGCQNPQSWDDTGGIPMTIDEIMERVKDNGLPVTLSGGDPLMNPDRLRPLLEAMRENRINVWVYTGYTYEELIDDPIRRPLLDMIDVLADGPFILSQRDTSLLFRGSANQRLIDIRGTRAASSKEPSSKEPVLWKSTF